jgi:hypothetical protein
MSDGDGDGEGCDGAGIMSVVLPDGALDELLLPGCCCPPPEPELPGPRQPPMTIATLTMHFFMLRRPSEASAISGAIAVEDLRGQWGH